MQFVVGAWHRSLVDDAPVTFQVIEFDGSGGVVRAKIFKTFYGGKMLCTEDWLRLERLADCREVEEPKAT